MGLSITAYSNLKSVGKHVDGAHCPVEGHIVAFCYDVFPQSFRGLPILARDMDFGHGFFNAGCFQATPETESHSFTAGVGAYYNNWRLHLARQFNPMRWETDLDSGLDYLTEPDPDKPFYELLWFADNEGSIGPEAAADLTRDYRQYRDVYRALDMADPFDDWGRAFELAADNGLIHFH